MPTMHTCHNSPSLTVVLPAPWQARPHRRRQSHSTAPDLTCFTLYARAEWLIQQTGSQADTAEEQLLLQQVGLHMEARTAAMQAEAAARRSGTDDTSSRTATDAPDRAGSSNSLSSSGDAAGSGSGSDVDAERDGPQTAAPAGDVTWLFRRVLAMPPVQGLEALSLADLTKGGPGGSSGCLLCVC